MTTIRPAAVAGTFYPGDQGELTSMVDALLSAAKSEEPCPKVIIAPHAGYIYSGSIAAKVYSRLANRQHEISRVVLLGPSHKVGFKGIAASTADKFSTPLGDIPLAVESIKFLAASGELTFMDQAHEQEHSLEVHLPFLQRALGAFELVPLVVGNCSKEHVAKVLEHLWGGDETLIVISSDLSHFHEYAEAQSLDSATAKKIVSRADNLNGKEACGCMPLNGLLYLARHHEMELEEIEVLNSGDTAGSKDRVVGYGAFVVNDGTLKQKDQDYSLSNRQTMLQVARDAIMQALIGNKEIKLQLNLFPTELLEKKGSFVTININDRLRGCIGSLSPQRPLILDIIHNAQAAAFRDPRFKPLTVEEFKQIDIHISVLTEARQMNVNSRAELIAQLQPGEDGIILKEKGKSATYLPSVWEKLPQAETFISELRRKAGLDPNGWDESTEVLRYHTIEFS
jgi:AmmeMemoRadiSam system protein B/AmmeMemoRadiSam system protein A